MGVAAKMLEEKLSWLHNFTLECTSRVVFSTVLAETPWCEKHLKSCSSIMGIEFFMSTKNPSSGIVNHGKETAEEMKRPWKLGMSSMMETCQSRGEGITCPIPQKTNRLNRERDLRVVHDLSDIITSKASPPYYVGSPPVRASNPLIHDSQFCAWAVQSAQQPPGIPIPTKGFNICCNRVREGFHTMA